MADRDSLAEAYNVLGGIQDAAKQSEQELRSLAPKLVDEQKNLEALLEKAEGQGDEENITRARMLLEQVQQAWVTIQQTVGDDAPDDDGGEPESEQPTEGDSQMTTPTPDRAGSETPPEPTEPAPPADMPAGAAGAAPDGSPDGDEADTGESDANEASDQAPTDTDAEPPEPPETEPSPEATPQAPEGQAEAEREARQPPAEKTPPSKSRRLFRRHR